MRTGSRVEFKPLKRMLWTRLKGTTKHVLDTSACFGSQWSREWFVFPSLLWSTSHPSFLPRQDPVLPNALKKAREDAIRHGRSEESSKSVDTTLGQSDHNRKSAEVMSTSDIAAGRPATKFIDVGTKFLDPKDHLRRMKESERRARIRSKKVPKRHIMAQ